MKDGSFLPSPKWGVVCEKERSTAARRAGCPQEEKLLLGKIHVSQNMQTWEGKNKLCRKDGIWWICEVSVSHRRAMPSRGSKAKRLLPKEWEVGRENRL